MTSASALAPSLVASRQSGLDRLNGFLPNAGPHYAGLRNFDHGPGDRGNVSQLSPYLRHRLITEEEVARAVLARFKLASAEKFIQEVCWRTYWKGWLEHRPQVWRDYLAAIPIQQAAIAKTKAVSRAYEDAISGRTGIECFDAWARELIETGYLHNHARMWFASIWIYTLKLPWVLGADFFFRHLLDGDPASNTLSWRWVCGLQTIGKTYLARADNIAKYTQGRFNPQGQLAQDALPLTGEGHPPAASLPDAHGVSTAADAVLILTEDDLHAEGLALGQTKVTGVIALDPSGLYPRHARQVLAFKAGAVQDALARAVTHFACDGVLMDAAASQDIANWVRAHKTQTVVTAYQPAGLQQQAFAPVQRALGEAGVDVLVLRRAWDSAFWPHAGRGFFQLREKIPKALELLRAPALL